jgi:hypothetical protein
MISIARTFGAPESVPAGNVARSRSCAGRERGAQQVEPVQPLAQSGLHVGDDVHDVGVALDHAELVDAHGSHLRHATDVVAAEIDEHQVLGPLLGIGEQLGLERPVLLGGLSARPRPGDGTHVDLPPVESHEDLRRCADQHRSFAAHEEQVRARIDDAQVAVDRKGVHLERDPELLGEHHLEDVAGLDVLLGALHVLVERLPRTAAMEVHRGAYGGRGLRGR